MAIVIRCEKCDYRARVRDELAGKHVACPNCRAVIRVGAENPASATVPGGEFTESIGKARVQQQSVRSSIRLDRSHLLVAVCSSLAGAILTLLIVAIWPSSEPERAAVSGTNTNAPAPAVPRSHATSFLEQPAALQQVPHVETAANTAAKSAAKSAVTAAAEPAVEPAPVPDDTIRFQALPADEPVTTLALTEDQNFLILTHQTANKFSVYDTQARAFVATVPCRSPRSVLCRGQQVFIANHGEGTVSVYSQGGKWPLVATLFVGPPGIVHLSAPCRQYFRNELIVTCHGDGRQASYRDPQIYLLNTQTKQSRKIAGASLASVSFDGDILITQESFNLSSAGGVNGYDFQEYIVGNAEPRFRSGDRAPFLLQYAPGSYWVGRSKVLGGSPLTQILEKKDEILIPDHSQKIVYSSSGLVLRALRLNVLMSEIGVRRVVYPEPYTDFSRVWQSVYREGDYLLDHPIAFTQANRLTFFIHCAEGGVVLTAETEAFETPTGPLEEPVVPEPAADSVPNPQPEQSDSASPEDPPKSDPKSAWNGQGSSFRETMIGSDSFNRLVKDFRNSRLSGQLDEAVVAAEALHQLAKSEFGPADDRIRQAAIWIKESKDLRRFMERVALLQEQQEFQLAEEVGRRVLDLDLEYFGEGHEQTELRAKWLAAINAEFQKQQETFLALQQAASKSRADGNYEEALKENEKLLELRRQQLGDEHSAIAIILLRVAQARQGLGQSEASIADLEQALRISKNRLEPDDYRLKDIEVELLAARWMAKCDPKTQTTLVETRLLFGLAPGSSASQEKRQEAIAFLEDLRRFVERSSGSDTAIYHDLLVAIRKRYELQRDWTSALGAADDALLAAQKLYGKNHPQYIDDLEAVFSLGDLLSDPRLAFWAGEGFDIAAELEGIGGPRSVSWACLWARTLAIDGQAALAADLLRATIPRAKRLYGEVHHRTATAYCLLSEYCLGAGQLADGKAAAEKGIQLFETLGIVNDSGRCRALMALAQWHESKGQTDLELAIREDCVATMGQVFGEDSIQCLREKLSLADCWHRTGNNARALEMSESSIKLLFDSRKEFFEGLSEREQLAANSITQDHLSDYLNLICEGDGSADAACRTVMQWKGAVFFGHLQALELQDSPESRQQKDRCRAAIHELQGLLNKTLANPESGLQEQIVVQQRLTQLDHECRELSLLQRTKSAEANSSSLLQQVQELMPDDAVLVEFKSYDRRLGRTADMKLNIEPRLLAFVVRKSHPVHMVQLGPLRPITESAFRWEDQIRRILPVTNGEEPPEVRLRRLLWEPIDAHLGDASLVIVSPEAFMSSLPLTALPGREASRYLIEDYSVSMTPNAGFLVNLLRSNREAANGHREHSMLLIGDVDFSPAAGSSDRTAFSALPGTAVEINEIAAIHREYFPKDRLTLAKGKTPGEKHFRETATRHRFLHLATHGYSMPEEWRNLRPSPQRDLREFLKSAIPDALNGIILSRAEAPARGGPDSDVEDDGRLTSLEVSMLDLRHIEMTVLSACETTLGVTAEGEGMLGLQRACQSAGVKTTVTSLWKVDDAATQALMVEFYQNLWEKKMTRVTALRQAQLAMLNDYDVSSRTLAARGLSLKPSKQGSKLNQRLAPYYWASFVLSGDWR